ITPYSSPLTFLSGSLANLPIDSEADRQGYLDALDALSRSFPAYETRLRGQWRRGMTLPAAELPLVLGFIRGFGAPPASSPFKVDESRLAGMDPASRARFLERVDAAIADVVDPAVDRLAAYLDGPY